MRNVVALIFISASAIAAASCSLFVSLDGLSGDDGGGSADSGNDACATCVDGGNGDGASPQDSAADASTDAGVNPCMTANSGTAGPRMIQADGYCIDSTEVTVAQYMQFIADGGASVTQPAQCAWNTTFAPDTDNVDIHGNTSGCTGSNVDVGTKPNHPISCVDWCDAWSYCAWAGKRLCGSIAGGSLPHDNVQPNGQWYLGCATVADNTYPVPGSDGGECDLSSTSSIDVGTSKCIGGYPGLYDMVGNVEEWIDACDSSGVTDGGPRWDGCNDEGDGFLENFSGPGCQSNDTDRRGETWASVGFRCCSK